MRSPLLSASLAMSLAMVACKTREEAPSEGTPSRMARADAMAHEHLALVAAPPTGDVKAVVREAMNNAAAERRRVVVYVGAPWCEPCRKLHEAATRGELDALFGNLLLLEFDMDRDGARLHAAGYDSKYIPLLALPADDGAASGRQVEGAIKGDGAVAFIVPRLARLLAP
jgi:thiol-disulfide isomerase/thioredoxin